MIALINGLAPNHILAATGSNCDTLAEFHLEFDEITRTLRPLGGQDLIVSLQALQVQKVENSNQKTVVCEEWCAFAQQLPTSIVIQNTSFLEILGNDIFQIARSLSYNCLSHDPPSHDHNNLTQERARHLQKQCFQQLCALRPQGYANSQLDHNFTKLVQLLEQIDPSVLQATLNVVQAQIAISKGPLVQWHEDHKSLREPSNLLETAELVDHCNRCAVNEQSLSFDFSHAYTVLVKHVDTWAQQTPLEFEGAGGAKLAQELLDIVELKSWCFHRPDDKPHSENSRLRNIKAQFDELTSLGHSPPQNHVQPWVKPLVHQPLFTQKMCTTSIKKRY